MDGFVEISQKEMMEVDGGGIITVVVVAAAIVVAQAINPQKAY